MFNPVLFVTLTAVLGSASVHAGDAGLREALEARWHGDRTGACVAAAVVGSETRTAFICADPAAGRTIDEHTTFEIGSVTKTMTAALLAEEIAAGRLTLDTPLAKLLPEGTKVPAFNDQPITLRHVVTHTSGLPSLPARMTVTDPADPYAAITPKELLDSLGDVTLREPPGTTAAYSNFAMMVLSYGLARHTGKDFESLLRARLLHPLGMRDAYIAKAPDGGNVAVGHLPTREITSPWRIPVDMAGVGGLRASLADLVRYVEASLGRGDAAIVAALARTHEPVLSVGKRELAMNWMRVPSGNRTLLMHGGGTGGFSSVVVLDPKNDRGVVVLVDTSLTALGGLDSFALHLLDGSAPAGTPRRVVVPAAQLVDDLVGDYRFDTGMKLALTREQDGLAVQAEGQPKFTLGYDSAGDFYPLLFDAILRPVRSADGHHTFLWYQGGGEMKATRVSQVAKKATAPRLEPAQLQAYVGNYPLTPQFALEVTTRDGKLYVRGTGQQPLEVAAVAPDVFVADIVAAEIAFSRGADGKVEALTLKQHGQNLRGEKQ